MQTRNSLETIGLLLSANDLPRFHNVMFNNNLQHDSFVVFYLNGYQVGVTEVCVGSFDPNWTSLLMFEYKFHVTQALRFKVYYKDPRYPVAEIVRHTFLGEASCSVKDLVQSGWRIEKQLQGKDAMRGSVPATITVRGDNLINCTPCSFRCQFHATGLRNSHAPFRPKKNLNAYVQISRRFEDGTWGVVGKNRSILFSPNETNFTWATCSTSLIAICNGDEYAPIKFSVINCKFNGRDKLVGETDDTCLRHILNERRGGEPFRLYVTLTDVSPPTRVFTGLLHAYNPEIDSLTYFQNQAVAPVPAIEVEVLLPCSSSSVADAVPDTTAAAGAIAGAAPETPVLQSMLIAPLSRIPSNAMASSERAPEEAVPELPNDSEAVVATKQLASNELDVGLLLSALNGIAATHDEAIPELSVEAVVDTTAAEAVTVEADQDWSLLNPATAEAAAPPMSLSRLSSRDRRSRNHLEIAESPVFVFPPPLGLLSPHPIVELPVVVEESVVEVREDVANNVEVSNEVAAVPEQSNTEASAASNGIDAIILAAAEAAQLAIDEINAKLQEINRIMVPQSEEHMPCVVEIEDDEVDDDDDVQVPEGLPPLAAPPSAPVSRVPSQSEEAAIEDGAVTPSMPCTPVVSYSNTYSASEYLNFFMPASMHVLRQTRAKPPSTFTNFIAGGCEIGMLVAIDFTASNGHYRRANSLHYVTPASTAASVVAARKLEAISKGEGDEFLTALAHSSPAVAEAVSSINSTDAGENPETLEKVIESMLLGELNAYQKVILSVGSIIQEYDTDKKFPLMGFGARLCGPGGLVARVQHCFSVHPEKFEVDGLTGIMEAYNDSMHFLEFSGPTNFSPLIRHCEEYVRERPCTQEKQNYFILVIITDGNITDLRETIDAIVSISHLPVSIIIIGVGNADFSHMIKLDGDVEALVDSNGRKAARDIVQFVPFNGVIEGGMNALRQEVLEEVPRQLLEYMHSAEITPNPVQHLNEDLTAAAGAVAGAAARHYVLPPPRPKVVWEEED